MTQTLRQMIVSAALLAAFATVGSCTLAVTEQNTRQQILENQRRTLVDSLNQLVPTSFYDNDPLGDTIEIHDPDMLGDSEPVTVYRARRGRKPIAALFTIVAPDGYSGPITLLVGIDAQGRLIGVRVVSHRETPGLGDGIELRRSDWIRGFAGKSLDNPDLSEWKVRRDGGAFDQFTGATITPRAVVKAVRKALIYFAQNRELLLNEPPRAPWDASPMDDRAEAIEAPKS